MRTLPYCLLALIFVVSCGGQTESPTTETPAKTVKTPTTPSAPVTSEPEAEEEQPAEEEEKPAEEEEKPAEKVELFGAKINKLSEKVDFDALMADLEVYKGKRFVTAATIRAVCSKKGCWMEVRSTSDAAGPALTVRFFNYGFFMPLDGRGAHATMDGTLAIQKLTAEQVAHYEEEGQTFPIKTEDGGAIVPTFTARGVELRGRTK